MDLIIYIFKMSFFLVMTDHTFQVVNEKDYVTGNILSSGEFSTMNNMLQQLQHSCVLIRLQRIVSDSVFVTEKVSPFLKLTRTDDVTSSGRSKYDISDEDDPYANVDLSEDEYIPLHHSDSSGDSDSSSHTPVLCNKRVDFRAKQIKVKKRLFKESNGDGDGESVASASTSFSLDHHHRDQQLGETLAVVTVRQSKVEIDMLAPMHAGNYVVPLFRKTQQNDLVFLQGYIIKKKLENHRCVAGSVETSETVSFCDTIRNEYMLTCNLEICCPKGKLIGYEKFIVQGFEKHVAILIYQSPTDIERNLQGTKNTCTTQFVDITEYPMKLRQHACLYCGELRTCIGRHLQTVHRKEEEIINLTHLKGQAKAKALRAIRYLGDKKYNDTVQREKRIPVRKPIIQLVSDSVHCPSCGGLVGRRTFSRHHLKCTNRQPDRLKRINQLEYEENTKTCVDLDAKILEELLKDLQDDEVSSIIKKDKLIQGLGIYMSKSNRSRHQMKNSRSQMRRCARLLLIMRKMDPSVHDFKDCLVSSKYGLIMNATRVLCRQAEDSRKIASLKYPTVALQIGPMISTLISRLRRFYLEHENLSTTSPEVQALESFNALHRSEFCVEITRDALNTANTNKFKAKKELPKPADIQKLRDYCKKTFEETYSLLKNEDFEFARWKLLGQVLLCQIMVFNRRRPGEISRTLLDDYRNKKKVNQEQYESLNRLEIICANMFTMIHIKGKRGKTLGILLQEENIKGLDLYISLREKAGIPHDNPYVFAFNSSEGHLCAAKALKFFTMACGAENPESLTGTDLRKHAATMCQLFNLNENQLKQMADFMGHTFNVHLNHYRMPEQTTQIINISRFLSVVGDKDVYKHRGKSWDELQLSMPADVDNNDDVDGDDFNCVDDADNDVEIDVQPHSPVDENLAVLQNDGLQKTALALSERKSPKRKRVPSRRYQDSTPRKSPWKSHTQVASSPNSIELLNILANPSNRKKTTSVVKHVKKRWNEKEIKFMTEKFSEFLDKRKPLPKIKYVNMVFQENRDVFQEGRSGCALYCWIQNQRAKM